MYSLETIIALNNRRAVKPATGTRKNSALVKRDFAIIHSATFRETQYYSKNSTRTIFPKNGNPYQRIDKHSRAVFTALKFWNDYGDEVIDSLVGAIFDNRDLHDCEQVAIQRAWPDWKFQRLNSCGTFIFSAVKAGNLETRVSGINWRHLHAKLQALKK